MEPVHSGGKGRGALVSAPKTNKKPKHQWGKRRLLTGHLQREKHFIKFTQNDFVFGFRVIKGLLFCPSHIFSLENAQALDFISNRRPLNPGETLVASILSLSGFGQCSQKQQESIMCYTLLNLPFFFFFFFGGPDKELLLSSSSRKNK